MIDLNPTKNVAKNPHISQNLLSSVQESQELDYVNIGFACISSKNVLSNIL